MQVDKEQLNPTWNLIFQEIGKQLHDRSGLLAKRVLLIFIPALVIIFLIQLLARISTQSSFGSISIQLFVSGVLTVVVVLFITAILNSILKIEQVIWLDSYFDGKNLTPKESWRIARKLYWAWSYVQFKLFYRYYLWVILAFVGLSVLGFYTFAVSDFAKSASGGILGLLAFIFIVILGSVSLFLTRYLKIKLSYIPFIFLDRYHGESVHSSDFWNGFFSEMRELNKLSQGDSFNKNVMLEIGADLAMTVVEHVAGQIQYGFELAGGVLPSGVGAAVAAAGTTVTRGIAEVGHRIILFAKLTGRYVLYRYAFQKMHNKPYNINEYIYSLKD
ncbi:MAG: hypothetical protein A2660_01530 [Candidatus Doudnabacteria bacterium RIFCSPHIGHO2_01_FULL_45_18]|uniref:Uncharacterized protein n=1 Tax=Candidatus Doudnabacteria bacterium RIFCSPHIGHO2_01_FULL_45_18 TaxID=1817823 RepID=A0A1F5NQB5_9BACT|nr:MAG: hypothetical protein A2660_01530 [Candidatus Doudnabacteria bacterium RIFCSPHIGHO2_01_FULL_45_18]